MEIKYINKHNVECTLDEGAITAFVNGDEVVEFEYDTVYFDRMETDLTKFYILYDGKPVTLEDVIGKLEANLLPVFDKETETYNHYKDNLYA